jgi:hypothetical protein
VLATEIADWSEFFVAMAGAAAALAGLLFVAISINVKEILSDQSLPRRAGQTVALLVSSLLVSGVALLPDVSEPALGVALLVVTGGTWAFIARMVSRESRPGGPGGAEQGDGSWRWRVALTQVATLPGVIGSIVVIAGSPNGLYFLAAGILLSFAVAVINAWVLMVEILR